MWGDISQSEAFIAASDQSEASAESLDAWNLRTQDIDLQNIVTPASREMRRTISCSKEIRYFTKSVAAPWSQKFINPQLYLSPIQGG